MFLSLFHKNSYRIKPKTHIFGFSTICWTISWYAFGLCKMEGCSFMCTVVMTAALSWTKWETHTQRVSVQPASQLRRSLLLLKGPQNVCAVCEWWYELGREWKLELACVYSKSIHGCDSKVGSCSVCADLMEARKTFCESPYGTKSLCTKDSRVFRSHSFVNS